MPPCGTEFLRIARRPLANPPLASGRRSFYSYFYVYLYLFPHVCRTYCNKRHTGESRRPPLLQTSHKALPMSHARGTTSTTVANVASAATNVTRVRAGVHHCYERRTGRCGERRTWRDKCDTRIQREQQKKGEPENSSSPSLST